MDTKGEHRTHAEGSPRGNPYDLTYSPSGRLIEKYRNNHSVTTSATVDMHYSYCDDYQPHAVRHIFDEENKTHCDLRWDPAGNLGQISVSLKDNVFDHGRFLFWTVDNRMHAAVDDKHYSYYTYDYTGERRLKLTGESNRLDVNADFMTTGTLLNTPTLYPSAYLVLTSKGYTKHYYAGADRVAASLGGGGLKATGSNPGMQDRAKWLFWESHERVNGRMLQENDHECIWQSSLFTQEYYESIKDIPGRMNASVEFYLNDLYYNLKMLAEEQHQEKDVYFYHSDHLGSANWITDGSGIPVQHLQYLPFGEPFVDQHPAGYQERFRFTGKERDEETGYGYFGARYMDHELTAMWLSVDPMADKYPSISPYSYCGWNPINSVDLNGDSITLSSQAWEALKYAFSSTFKGGMKNVPFSYNSKDGKLLYEPMEGNKYSTEEQTIIDHFSSLCTNESYNVSVQVVDNDIYYQATIDGQNTMQSLFDEEEQKVSLGVTINHTDYSCARVYISSQPLEVRRGKITRRKYSKAYQALAIMHEIGGHAYCYSQKIYGQTNNTMTENFENMVRGMFRTNDRLETLEIRSGKASNKH